MYRLRYNKYLSHRPASINIKYDVQTERLSQIYYKRDDCKALR